MNTAHRTPRAVMYLLFALASVAPQCLTAAPACALQPDADQLQQRYADALLQLKNAQDRKNELATENERLTTEIAALKRDLSDAQARQSAVVSRAAAEADKTFFYRSHYAAWTAFARRYPDIDRRWQAFYNSGSSIGQSEP